MLVFPNDSLVGLLLVDEDVDDDDDDEVLVDVDDVVGLVDALVDDDCVLESMLKDEDVGEDDCSVEDMSPPLF